MSARPREDTSPPRRVRFEGALFADDFAGYGDGNLAGQGPWTAIDGGYASLLLQSHQATGSAFGPKGNSVLDVFPLARLAGDWWIAFRLIPTAPEAVTKDVAIWIGALGSNALYVDLTLDLLTGPPGSIFVTAGADGGVSDGSTVMVGNLTLAHTVALSRTAVDGHFHVWVDGVEVMVVVGVDVSLTDDGRFDLFINGDGATTQPRVTHVEVGLGDYTP